MSSKTMRIAQVEGPSKGFRKNSQRNGYPIETWSYALPLTPLPPLSFLIPSARALVSYWGHPAINLQLTNPPGSVASSALLLVPLSVELQVIGACDFGGDTNLCIT